NVRIVRVTRPPPDERRYPDERAPVKSVMEPRVPVEPRMPVEATVTTAVETPAPTAVEATGSTATAPAGFGVASGGQRHQNDHEDRESGLVSPHTHPTRSAARCIHTVGQGAGLSTARL